MHMSAFDAVEVALNHGQAPSSVGPEPQMAMEYTNMIAIDPPQDHGNTPTTMGFEQLLNLESTPPTMRPGGTEDKALSEQVIEGAFLFLEKRPKRHNYHETNTLLMTNRILHKNWETPKDRATMEKLYNHHKVLIFACYRLYKYIDFIARK